MQSIWSRSAQTKVCRGGPYLQNATAVARRTTTAASRRRLKVGDVFTACYTAMFATAAVADAKMKDKRRKDWDKLIEEARGSPAATSGLPAPAELSDSPTAEPQRNQFTTSVSKFNTSGRPIRLEPSIDAVFDGLDLAIAATSHEVPLEAQLSVLDMHIQQVLLGTKTIEGAHDQHDLDQTDFYEASQRQSSNSRLRAREPKSRVHLDKMEEMVAKLVSRLLLNTKAIEKANNVAGLIKNSTENLKAERQRITNRIEDLQAGSTRLPEYHSLGRSGAEEERENLNQSIEAILQSSKVANIDIMIAKICYNLLVSTAPPSIDTYTLMIKLFRKLGQHSFSQVIVDSFFQDSKFRPNEETIAEILYHYAACRDRKGFEATIRRLRGVDGDMRVQRVFVNDLQDRKVQSWALKTKVIHRNGALYQKVPRDAQIFGALIHGCLEFSKIDRAIMFMKAAIREGCHVSSTLLRQMLDFCVRTENSKAGLKLLSALVSPWTQPTYGHDRRQLDESLRNYVYDLLAFCGVQFSLESGSCHGLPSYVNRSAFDRMLGAIHQKSADESIKRLALDPESVQQESQASADAQNVAISRISISLSGCAARLKQSEDEIVRLAEASLTLPSLKLSKTLERQFSQADHPIKLGTESQPVQIRREGGSQKVLSGLALVSRQVEQQATVELSVSYVGKESKPKVLTQPGAIPTATAPGRWTPMRHQLSSHSPASVLQAKRELPGSRTVLRRTPALNTVHSHSAYDNIDDSGLRAALA